MLEQRGNQVYVYRYQRVGGRVRRVYAGCTPEAIERAAAEIQRRRQDRAGRRADRLRHQACEAAADALREAAAHLALLTRLTLLRLGFHHRRGEWRRCR